MCGDELISQSIPSQPNASLLRTISSSLFSYFFFALAGYAVAQYTTKTIAGGEQGFQAGVVSAFVWLVASTVGGFVAGYRAAGHGWLSGLLVGIYTILGVMLISRLLLVSAGVSWGDFIANIPASQRWILLIQLVLILPCATYGGVIGDDYFRQNGHLEDRYSHTLFSVPWWHWAWLLCFIVGSVVSDIVLSGHMIFLAFWLTWQQLSHFHLPINIFSFLAPSIGFFVTFLGMVNLHDALSVRTNLSLGSRIGKAFWGLLLVVFAVDIIWKIISGIVRLAA